MIEGYEALRATFLAGDHMTVPVDVSRVRHIMKIHMPPAWTAAPLTFQVSPDGDVWRDLYTFPRATPSVNVSVSTGEGGGGSSSSWSDETERELSVAVGVSRAVPVAGLSLAGERFLRLRSGTAQSPVAQLARREIDLVVVAAPPPEPET